MLHLDTCDSLCSPWAQHHLKRSAAVTPPASLHEAALLRVVLASQADVNVPNLRHSCPSMWTGQGVTLLYAAVSRQRILWR